MQRTEKYFEPDAFRTQCESVILAAEPAKRPAAGALRWTAQCFTRRAAVSLPTGAP